VQADRGFMSAYVWQVLVFSFCVFLCCVIVGEVADTLRWKEMCRCVAFGGSVSTHTIVGLGTPRCLQVTTVLCVVF
jgi:hypothetical protein